jgi:hypothetical protein
MGKDLEKEKGGRRLFEGATQVLIRSVRKTRKPQAGHAITMHRIGRGTRSGQVLGPLREYAKCLKRLTGIVLIVNSECLYANNM